MKHLFLLGGPMGVGKTAVSRRLRDMLTGCAFLDGDWCWDMHPFTVTPETRELVMDNICHVLNGFLRCSAFEYIVFCWVMHRQEILDTLLSRLDTHACRVHLLSLVCDEKTLTERLEKDIAAGLRTADVLERAWAYLPLYDALSTQKVDTTRLSVCSCAQTILIRCGISQRDPA